MIFFELYFQYGQNIYCFVDSEHCTRNIDVPFLEHAETLEIKSFGLY